MKESLITHINWVVTFLAQVCIFGYLLRLGLSKRIFIQKIKYSSRRYVHAAAFIIILFLEALIVWHLPIREGYDNYHGILNNLFDKLFKETVAIQFNSGLNWLLGYRMLNNFILNYFLSLGCGLLLASIIYLYFRDKIASLSAFVLFIFLPPSLVLIKSIGSVHINTFLLLLAITLLSLLKRSLVNKEKINLDVFFCLAVLLPVMNNVRQEFLFFLLPFFLLVAYQFTKGKTFKKNRAWVICFVSIFILLFALFYSFQFSLRHQNFPSHYFNPFYLFSATKFSFLSFSVNKLLGGIVLIAVFLLIFQKKYFLSFSLLWWLLLASNIYSVHRAFPLQFYRHELYLALPYIFAIATLIHYLCLFFRNHHYRVFLSFLYLSLICSIVYNYLAVQRTKFSVRTTDIVLQFLNTEVNRLPKNRTLLMPDINENYSKSLFEYISRLYYGRFPKKPAQSLGDVIIYLPEVCDFPGLDENKQFVCQQAKSCLGMPLAEICFQHGYNSFEHPDSEGFFLKTGFYELSEECYDKVE